jgi:hypothetical protein
MKRRTMINFGVYPNPAAVSLNDSLTNRWSHPGAGVFPSSIVQTLEEVEYFCLVLRFNSYPIVADRKVPLPVVLVG